MLVISCALRFVQNIFLSEFVHLRVDRLRRETHAHSENKKSENLILNKKQSIVIIHMNRPIKQKIFFYHFAKSFSLILLR